jgi:hypothetical protein
VFDGFLWQVQAVQPVPYRFFGGRHERDIEGTAAEKFSGHSGQRNFAICAAQPHIEVLELVSLYFGN